MPRLRLALPLALLWLCPQLACGGDKAPARTPAANAEAEGVTLKGYNSQGGELVCETPREACPDRTRNADFADQCRLAGYRLLQCGCDELCSGKVDGRKKHFDSTGRERSCAPETQGCAPPETSASFQDACTDGRHRLVVCGCEWLCDGPLAPTPAASE